jgi:hypothetical protein
MAQRLCRRRLEEIKMMVERHPILIKCCIVLASSLLMISVIEVASRLIGLDLEGSEASFKSVPIYYRQPIEPVGEVFFRRPGPDFWKGNILGGGYDKMVGGNNNPYLKEPETTASYDGQGFRNPQNLTDWDIAVLGDSFTELGYLPYEDLFTTKLGQLLGRRVKNLGVSYTGSLTQTFYLKEYGISPSTKQSILVFFEGNDLADIETDASLLEQYRATGNRPYRNIERQTSFIKLIYHSAQIAYGKLRTKLSGNVNEQSQPMGGLTKNGDAYYVSPGGEIPVTLKYTPPGREELTAQQIGLLDISIRRYAETARALGLTPWLVFMPCKQRALHCCLRFSEKTDPLYVNWEPTNFPGLVEELAAKNGVKFINVTPALEKRAREGILTFNTIWDTHLNREGSRIVAEAIAEGLFKAENRSRSLSETTSNNSLNRSAR